MTPLLALLIAAVQPPASAEPALSVESGHFFSIDLRSEPPGIAEATRIPLRAETSCFGWLVQVAPRKGEVRVREELRLPTASPSWPAEGEIRVHDDRAGATKTFSDDLSDGMISSEWCIAAGDPIGRHHIQVFVGDQLLRRFDFEVVPDPDDRSI